MDEKLIKDEGCISVGGLLSDIDKQNKDELDLSRFTMLSNFGPDGKEAQILNSDMHLVDMINDVVVYYFEQIKELEDKGTYEEGYAAGFDNGYSERGRRK